MVNADQIQSARERVLALKGYLAIDRKRIDILEDEKLSQDPEFWNDAKEAEKNFYMPVNFHIINPP